MSVNSRSAILLSCFLLGGCTSDSPTAPTTDFITLDSVVPAAGTTLTPGDWVTFTAVVTATLVSSTGGFTTMVLQDQRNLSLLAPGEVAPQALLTKGTSTVTLTHTITIPESGSTLNLLLPIFVNESNRTAAMVRRSYPVR
jgi:hypothetical protein